MDIVFFGLTITSSWGNGHATTYRSLLKALHERGHRIQFFERNVEWYVNNRDLSEAHYAQIRTYDSWEDIRQEALQSSRAADVVIVGSYYPDAILLLNEILGHTSGPVCFYDIDTPITLEKLRDDTCSYLRREHIGELDLYLSFTGGPALDELEHNFSARRARALYCSCDPDIYFPAGGTLHETRKCATDMGYMGTYSDDRQPKLQALLFEPARRLPQQRFVVAGPLFPDVRQWPRNVWNVYHLSPREHRVFYLSSRVTLNITRAAMVKLGYSPSVRLFEAAACGAPIISDAWPGLEEFFRPGSEILVADGADDVVQFLTQLSPRELDNIAEGARAKVMGAHTNAHRAAELESYLAQASSRSGWVAARDRAESRLAS